MTWEIGVILAVLGIALVLFAAEVFRMDVTAMLAVSVLALTGVISPTEALAGFGNPAVVTVWSMFILTAGLSATGIADMIGRLLLKVSGTSEPRIIAVVMLTTGGLSAFMSNIGVAALMLPVTMEVARQTNVSPSRLLMPMAFASLLGGMTTLIGTPSNLVASNALEVAGKGSFSMFEFAPIGVPALLLGTLFFACVGRHLLPDRLPEGFVDENSGDRAPLYSHGGDETHLRVNIGEGSPFIGKTLAETRLGGLLGFRVDAIVRRGREISEVSGATRLEQGDGLLARASLDDLEDFRKWQTFELASGAQVGELLAFSRLVLVSVNLRDGSDLDGLTLKECDFRRRFDCHLLTVRNEHGIKRENLAEHRLKSGDRIQLEAKRESLPLIENSGQFENVELIAEESLSDIYPDSAALLEMAVPAGAYLVGLRLRDTGLSEDLKLRILGIARRSGSVLLPGGDERILEGDKLLVHGNREGIELIRGLQSLSIEGGDCVEPPQAAADRARCEVTLSPRSSLVGKSLRELNFRNRFGLQVDSIWRGGKSFCTHLRNMTLEFGDALLLSGPAERIDTLAKDRDFLLLTRTSAAPDITSRSTYRAMLAGGIMVGVIGMVIGGVLPVAVAALVGSAFMVAVGCLAMDEAYRAIDWKAVFLIACMIPLGVAMKDTGAAAWIAEGAAAAAKPFGVWGLLIGLYLMTALATIIVPTAALVVIMASIGIDASAQLGVPAEMMVMGIAMAASASFASPISHPSNILVMGPGGYRFVDYVKVGILLAAVVALTVVPMICLL